MDTKKVNKYNVTKKKIEYLCEAHLKQTINKFFSKIENIIPLLKEIENKRKKEYLYLDKEDFYYHFKSGFVFSNPDNKFEDSSFSPIVNSKDKKITKEVKERIKDDLEKIEEIPNKLKYADSETLNTLFGTIDIPKRCRGKVIYVHSKARGSETGINWKNAYKTINSAVNNAKDNDQIWIAEGVYVEDLVIDKKKIEIFGGFKGDEQKGWHKKNHKVKIKGSIQLTNVDYNTKLSSVELSDYEIKGTKKPFGVIHIKNATPLISNCVISDCKISSSTTGTCQDCSNCKTFAYSYGAGIFVENSNPIILACQISNFKISTLSSPHSCSSSSCKSSAVSCGGGIYNLSSAPTIINTSIKKCSISAKAKGRNGNTIIEDAIGGAIYNENSIPQIINTTFEDNNFQDIYNSPNTSDVIDMNYQDLDSKTLKILKTEVICKKINENSNNNESIIYHLLKSGFLEMNCEKVEDYEIITNSLELKDNKLSFNQNYLYQEFRKSKVKGKINGIDFNWKTVFKDLSDGKLLINTNAIIDDLISVDFLRANIEKYEAKRLTDINSGHWDLWDSKSENNILIKMEKELVARNPKEDIQEGGIVGIDFGTKSTVVVYQEESDRTSIMQIGTGELKQEIKEKDFENPTIIQFTDINNFIESYKEKEGRPFTLWGDITTSHTAMAELQNSKSDDFYSFFYSLKQWAGGDSKKLTFKDKKENEIIIPEFKELKDNDIDPIEIYAYYIGSYINTLRNGIYLEYILSFPVSYEKSVCEKIINSFENGIRKSLPISILNNDEVMNDFSVTSGASEPAAYAISALEGYNIEPIGDEKIYYGIFDFGGGTTDFDFGIWKEDTDEDSLNDYIIEHFGSGYDRYLGGENLLEYLAFEVFKSNLELLRKEDINFTLPPECLETINSKSLISESQEAKLNMRNLMEKIRPIWEKKEIIENSKEIKSKQVSTGKKITDSGKGVTKVSLTNSNGDIKQIELKLIVKDIEKKIENRIDLGVDKFFTKMKVAFNKISNIEKINIFLAGNSSKSKFVKELFDKYIEKEKDSKIKYKLFKPLSGEINKNTEEVKPNGKTGVAFGIIKSREGGGIKVVDKNRKDDQQSIFQYYIGRKKKDKFLLVINRNSEYNCWYKFIPASEKNFEIYYTTDPLVERGNINIEPIDRKRKKNNNIDKKAFIYIKFIEPTVIEWIVSKEKPSINSIGEKIELNNK